MFLQWCRDELALSFIFVQRFVSWDRTRLRKGTTAETQTLCTMPRDRVVATRIGTFACRTFHRDAKASKRANLPTLKSVKEVTSVNDNRNRYIYIKLLL